jgi:hypothetical protein
MRSIIRRFTGWVRILKKIESSGLLIDEEGSE